MKYKLIVAAIILIPALVNAEKPYFQQDVTYDIKAELDTESAVLAGIENIRYINNSPDTLHEIYFHLFYNAFQPGSYLDMQNRERGYYRISRLNEKDRGYMNIDLIKIDEIEIEDYVIDNTIMEVPLATPLEPSDSVSFYIEFTGQIPKRGSRAAHRGKQFDVGQWYPKPVVYDRYGWHVHQYLDHEFYAEFADFNIELTIPSDYIVAHMGMLLNEEEIFGGKLPMPEGDSIITNALESLEIDSAKVEIDEIEVADDTTGSPMSDTSNTGLEIVEDAADTIEVVTEELDLKTWKMRAENVHDFTFCADPKFIMDICRYKDTVIKTYYKKSTKKRWEYDVADYTRKAIRLFSENYFPYPYGQFSTVASLVSSGGMEYPQLTMISQRSALRGEQYLRIESIIAHELGHAWFAGILGFNETEQSFLDEGLASFATIQYMERYHGRRHNNFAYKKKWQRKLLPNGDERNDDQKRYISRAIMKNADPMITPPHLFKSGRYYGASYYKASTVYLMLQYVLGDEQFDRFMKLLFEKWAFKHPYLSDFQAVAEEIYGGNLDWFFRQWFTTTWTLDYSLDGFKTGTTIVDGVPSFSTMVSIGKRGRCISPLDVTFYFEDGSTDTAYIPVDVWTDGQTKFDTTLFFPTKPDKAVINPDIRLGDINRLNNSSGLPPVNWQFMVPRFIYRDNYVENYVESYTIAHNPTVWYNSVDGAKIGYRFDGSHLGVVKKMQLEVSLGLNNRAVNYDAGFTDRLVGINPNLQYHFRSRELEGRGRQEVGIFWDRRSRRSGNFFRMDLSLNRNYQYDSEYIYGAGWSIGDINTIELNIARRQGKRFSEIYFRTSLISSIPGTDYNFTRAEADLTFILFGIVGNDTRIHIKGGISDGNVPLERRFFLSSADPYEIWESPLFRSKGTLPDQWKDDGHLFKPGGAGLYGYLDQGMTGTRMVSAKIERDLPRIRFPVSIPYLSKQVRSIAPTMYLASGYVWEEPENMKINDILSEAGLSFNYSIPYLNLFISENEFTLYLPLWLSDPALDEDKFKWRWLFSITP